MPRQNFYGFDGDFGLAGVNIATLEWEHDQNGAVTWRDQFRYRDYTRAFRITEPEIPDIVAPGTPPSDIAVTRSIQGQSHETFLDNQSEARLRFDSWSIPHPAVAGVEVGRQTSSPTFFQYADVPDTNLLDPDPNQPFTGAASVLRTVSVTAVTQAAYLIDTAHSGDKWLLTAAVRLDRFDANVVRNPPFFAAEHVDLVPTWRTAAYA